MISTFAPDFSAGHRAALSSGKSLLYVVPPAAWATVPLFLQMGRGTGITLVLAPVEGLTDELGTILAGRLEQRIVVASGLARTTRLLETADGPIMIATPAAARALASRSAARPSAVERVVLLWPELFDQDARRATDDLLADATRAQRVIVTADPEESTDFADRYAHRAPLLNAAPPPSAPLGPARMATIGPAQVPLAVRAALDTMDPVSVVLWDPSEVDRWAVYERDPTIRLGTPEHTDPAALTIATDLPTPQAFEALRAVAAEVLVLARPWQRDYLRRMASPLRSVHLSGEVDRARDRASALRQAIAGRLESEEMTDALLTLAPLFDRFDPAAVAAAAVSVPHDREDVRDDLPTWVHFRVDSGKRHGIRAGDIVGALLNAVGIPKDHVGRIDLHDSFAIVEVRAVSARRAMEGLQGSHLRGRAVAVALDRR